jgi:hypothetical protein
MNFANVSVEALAKFRFLETKILLSSAIKIPLSKKTPEDSIFA